MSQGQPAAPARVRPPRRVFIVLPAFNEAARIGRLLDNTDDALDEAGLAYQIIVVDDGSTDDTARIVRERALRMPILLKQHAQNQGLGATIRDGLLAAVELAAPADVIITMDADDTHSPGLILRMVRLIREGFDVVIASRYQPGSRSIGVPWSRRVLSYGASWLFRVLYPISGVRDYTCGYRAYRAEVIQQAVRRYADDFLNQDGFQCMVDILLKLRPMQLVFGEVPFILRYDQKEGATKMRIGRTIRQTLTVLVQRKFTRWQ
jgi:dolichol-phosphate mannosyltransferase